MSLEISKNLLEQHGKRNNLWITGIPDDESDKNLEEKVIQVLSEIQVNISSSDIEACHRMVKVEIRPKKKHLYNLLIGNTPKKHQLIEKV